MLSKNIFVSLVLRLTCTQLLPSAATAGLLDGVAVCNKKDFTTAINEFRLLAANGEMQALVQKLLAPKMKQKNWHSVIAKIKAASWWHPTAISKVAIDHAYSANY